MLLPVAIFEGIAFSYNQLDRFPQQMLTPLCQVSESSDIEMSYLELRWVWPKCFGGVPFLWIVISDKGDST